MISKTTQPTLINWPSNNSPYDAKFTKCGDSEKSFSFKGSCLLIIAFYYYLLATLEAMYASVWFYYIVRLPFLFICY